MPQESSYQSYRNISVDYLLEKLGMVYDWVWCKYCGVYCYTALYWKQATIPKQLISQIHNTKPMWYFSGFV